MANDDMVSALGGLRPLAQPQGNVKRSYYRLVTSALAVYVGQPMDLDGNGEAQAATAGTSATVFYVGPVIGFSRDSRGKMGLPDAMTVLTQGAYLPGNTDAYVCIADDPNQEFVIQEASSGTALNTGNIGNTAGFIYTARSTSGNNYTGSSYAELSPGGVSTTTSGPLQLLGYTDNINSDGTYNGAGAYAKWIVKIAHHRKATFLPGTNIQ
jgi:hypothetical protein